MVKAGLAAVLPAALLFVAGCTAPAPADPSSSAHGTGQPSALTTAPDHGIPRGTTCWADPAGGCQPEPIKPAFTARAVDFPGGDADASPDVVELTLASAERPVHLADLSLVFSGHLLAWNTTLHAFAAPPGEFHAPFCGTAPATEGPWRPGQAILLVYLRAGTSTRDCADLRPETLGSLQGARALRIVWQEWDVRSGDEVRVPDDVSDGRAPPPPMWSRATMHAGPADVPQGDRDEMWDAVQVQHTYGEPEPVADVGIDLDDRRLRWDAASRTFQSTPPGDLCAASPGDGDDTWTVNETTYVVRSREVPCSPRGPFASLEGRHEVTVAIRGGVMTWTLVDIVDDAGR